MIITRIRVKIEKKIREQQKTFNLRVKLKRKITLTKRKKTSKNWGLNWKSNIP
jgi:hypothetical protein